MRDQLRSASSNRASVSGNGFPYLPASGHPAGFGGGKIWVLAAAAVLVLILVIWRLWPSPPPPCTDLARERQQIQDIVAKGQNSIAAALAESVLGQQNPPPCPDARRGLAALWYASSIE